MIDIDEKEYGIIKILIENTDIQRLTVSRNFLEEIANGIVITDDIISRNDLLEELQDYIECNQNLSGVFETMKVIVKNAPPYEEENGNETDN